MKKLVFSIAVLSVALLLQSFTSPIPGESETAEITISRVIWKAYKVSGSHEGTIDLKSGSLTFDDTKVTGGEFEIDMTSLTSTDLSGEYQGKLNGHLKSDDFFGVETYPTSTLIITELESNGKNAYKVKANITIKDITKQVAFDLAVYGNKASANLKIDRTDFGIKYGSGSFFEDLQDNMIYDEFDLVIDFEF